MKPIGCPDCGGALRLIDEVKVNDESGFLLKCDAHSTWHWLEGRDYLSDVSSASRRARVESPGPIELKDGDYIVLPKPATGPDGSYTFYQIATWEDLEHIGGPFHDIEGAKERARIWAQRKGSRAWLSHGKNDDGAWEFDDRPL